MRQVEEGKGVEEFLVLQVLAANEDQIQQLPLSRGHVLGSRRL